MDAMSPCTQGLTWLDRAAEQLSMKCLPQLGGAITFKWCPVDVAVPCSADGSVRQNSPSIHCRPAGASARVDLDMPSGSRNIDMAHCPADKPDLPKVGACIQLHQRGKGGM